MNSKASAIVVCLVFAAIGCWSDGASVARPGDSPKKSASHFDSDREFPADDEMPTYGAVPESPEFPFVEETPIPLVVPPAGFETGDIRIGEEVVLVGRCGGPANKNGCLILVQDGEEISVVSMNGAWPLQVRHLCEAHPSRQLIAEVRGVVSKLNEETYFVSPKVQRIWWEPRSSK